MSSTSKPVAFLLVALVLLLATALRTVRLDADPAPSMESAFITDEGWWARNARNQALFGQWSVDDFDQALYATPVYTGVVRAVFGLVGVGLWQTRLVSAACGVLAIALLGHLLWRCAGARVALAGMLVLALDPFSLSYNRVGFVESMPPVFMLAAFACVRASLRVAGWAALGGALALSAGFVKLNAFPFVLVPPLALILHATAQADRRAVLRRLVGPGAAYLGGCALAALVWVVAFIMPDFEAFVFQSGRLAAENRVDVLHVGIVLGMFGLNHDHDVVQAGALLTSGLPAVTLALLWALDRSLRVRAVGLREAAMTLRLSEWMALGWLVVFLGAGAMTRFGSDRRMLVFLYPLAMLAAHGLGAPRGERLAGTAPASSSRGNVLPALVVALAAVLFARAPIVRALEPWSSTVPFGKQPGIAAETVSALVSVTLGLAAFLITLAIQRLARWPEVGLARTSAILFVAAMVPASFGLFTSIATPSYSIQDASRTLAQALEPGSTVAGGMADQLLSGTPHRTLVILDRRSIGYGVFGVGWLDRSRPTHVLIDGVLADADVTPWVEEYLDGWGVAVLPVLATTRFAGDGAGGFRFGATLVRVRPRETEAQRASPESGAR